MKNITIILSFILIITTNYVYGGFADYTDEQAKIDTQKLIEEQENKFDYTKSNNNYLKNLYVKEGTISPEFDKQTIDYNLTLEDNIDVINIIANTEDDKASITGNGAINIKEQNKCKIDVTAESGTIRTYFINIIRPNQSIETTSTNTILNEEENTNVDVVTNNYNETEETLTKQKYQINKKYIIGIAIIPIIIVILIFYIKLKNK